MTNIQIIFPDQEERILYYQLFIHYYRGDLLHLTLSEWSQLTDLLTGYPTISQTEWGKKGLSILEKINEDDLKTFAYDFNRLFVGPNQLLASPFESSYLNFEGTVMQQETMMVRNFYYHEGLQVAEEGQFPDDHLHYELEFVSRLLTEAEKAPILKLFFEKHLIKWVGQHCLRVESFSQNPITLAMGYLLKDFLHLEKWMIEGEDSQC